MPLFRDLLWVDCVAGGAVGLAMLAGAPGLAPLYGLPPGLYATIALANVGYGLFSFSIARRAVRPMPLLRALVVANAAWALLCAVAVAGLWGAAGPLGLAHVAGEGVFVGGLAIAEWRSREALRTAR